MVRDVDAQMQRSHVTRGAWRHSPIFPRRILTWSNLKNFGQVWTPQIFWAQPGALFQKFFIIKWTLSHHKNCPRKFKVVKVFFKCNFSEKFLKICGFRKNNFFFNHKSVVFPNSSVGFWNQPFNFLKVNFQCQDWAKSF